MKVNLTVHYEDGSSGILEIEKPAGAHPDSIGTIVAGLIEAEKTGKRVVKIGRSKINPFSKPPDPLVVDDSDLTSREELLVKLKWAAPQKYQRLFGNE